MYQILRDNLLQIRLLYVFEDYFELCNEHGIEISEPKKSRGYSFTTQEYGEHKDEIRRLEEEKAYALTELYETNAELDKAAKKKVKLTEIDSVETGKTVFSGKVTVSKEDWNNVTTLAKKEVASQKQTKKLRKERDEAVHKLDELNEKFNAVSSELAEYKKKEEETCYFTRDKLKAESKRISREDDLSRELKKAKAFISACGLSSDYQQFRYNSTARKNILE